MFNLLVTGSQGWGSSSDTISAGRTLEFTDTHVEKLFQPQGKLNVSAVAKLPTVFACENSLDGNHVPARVGTILNIQLSGKEYGLDYVFDPDIPPIPNEILFGAAAKDLNINTTASIPESSRIHWSIKDRDLFRVLLRHQGGLRPKPSVFSLPNAAVDGSLVAVMMPFDAAFNPVYESLKGAIESLDMTCKRADDIWINDHVIQDVVHLISMASLVVCDLSTRNANVFYEAGIAHTLGKNVILLAQSKNDVPFDVSSIRHLTYLPNSEGLSKLALEIRARIEAIRLKG